MYRVYIGYDKREQKAYDVAEFTITNNAFTKLSVERLEISRLTQMGLMTRPIEVRDGKRYDVVSQAFMSTDFAITRFLVPLLCQHGWALFIDCDVVVLDDITKLWQLCDDKYAVMCVKHPSLVSPESKMDGQVQLDYPRKNWSSVMMFNCDHPSNRALNLRAINELPGRDLHRFCWLYEHEIGELPREWNWLVNVTAPMEHPKIAHFTLGGPWFEGWKGAKFDDIWLSANSSMRWKTVSNDMAT